MIEKYFGVLLDLRAGKVDLNEFLYEEGESEKGHSYDKNATKRFRLLKAMQYNRLDSDELVLLELFKAEIEKHRKAPFQGLFPALKLNAYLLLQYNKPEYSELFLLAKQSNFDTHCGFDYQYLVSAGIEETYAFIKKQDDEKSDAFYQYVGDSVSDCYISESELTDWKKYLNEEFPEQIVLNDLLDEIELLIDFEEKELLPQKIQEWQDAQQNWDNTSLNQLAYYKRLVKDAKGEIWAYQELYKLESTDWDKACRLQDVSRLLIENDRFVEAWRKIEESHYCLKQISDWRTVGLGRGLVENAFDVVLGINDSGNEVVQSAFSWASNEVRKMKNLHLGLLEKTVIAGGVMGDLQFKDRFSKRLKKEQKELELLNRKIDAKKKLREDSLAKELQKGQGTKELSFWSKYKMW